MKHLHPRWKYNEYTVKLLGDLEDHLINIKSYARLLAMESDYKEQVESMLEPGEEKNEYDITDAMLHACTDPHVRHAMALLAQLLILSQTMEDYWATTPEYNS